GVGARVDEKRDALLLRRLSNDGDAAGLAVDVVETRSLDDAILEVDADDPDGQQSLDIGRQRGIVVAVTALEVDGDGHVDGRHDARGDLMDEVERKILAVLESLGGSG